MFDLVGGIFTPSNSDLTLIVPGLVVINKKFNKFKKLLTPKTKDESLGDDNNDDKDK